MKVPAILQMAFLCLQVLYLQLGVAWYLQFPQITA
jgi:hypothetical protein